MAIVDQQGRLFGRLNLVDAVLVLLAIAIVPVGYGAYALFRTPPPRLLGVEPGTLQQESRLRIRIHGEHLRPYMRVSFGERQGSTFLFGSVSTAEVDVDNLPPGTYDVVLYDYAQERDRLPNALTITPSPLPSTQVVVAGMLTGLTDETAAQIPDGMTIPGVGEVLRVGRPVPEVTRVFTGRSTVEIPVATSVRVPLEIRVGCAVRVREGIPDCVIGTVGLAPRVVLLLETPLGKLPFQVDQVRGPQPLDAVEVRVRFVGDPTVLALLEHGDRDLGPAMNEFAAGAEVIEAGPVRRLPTPVTVLADTHLLVGSDLAARDVTLRLQGQRSTSGWIYRTEPLRPGGVFELRTTEYELRGALVVVSERGGPAEVPGR
jgi:hypothetical protein